jgi:hypothetical protein
VFDRKLGTLDATIFAGGAQAGNPLDESSIPMVQQDE